MGLRRTTTPWKWLPDRCKQNSSRAVTAAHFGIIPYCIVHSAYNYSYSYLGNVYVRMINHFVQAPLKTKHRWTPNEVRKPWPSFFCFQSVLQSADDLDFFVTTWHPQCTHYAPTYDAIIWNIVATPFYGQLVTSNERLGPCQSFEAKEKTLFVNSVHKLNVTYHVTWLVHCI